MGDLIDCKSSSEDPFFHSKTTNVWTMSCTHACAMTCFLTVILSEETVVHLAAIPLPTL